MPRSCHISPVFLPYSPVRNGAKAILGIVMQTVVKGYRGLSFLVGLNTDWLFVLGAVSLALATGAVLGMQALQLP